MAASSKFDLSSGSPDKLAYSSVPRGVYTSASLDRSGSFREGMDNRILSALPSMSRSGSTVSQGDLMSFFHGLPLNTKLMASDHKIPRQGEVKRVIAAAFGISPADSPSVSLNGKLVPASSLEDLKRVRTNLHESSNRARDRSRAWDEALSKFDKCFPSISTRKRSRVGSSLNDRLTSSLPGDRAVLGGSITKLGTQNHVISSSFEHEPQKLEERTKTALPNKRIRTSMVDVRMDARANALSRPPGGMDREREMFRLANNGAVQSEEKHQTLSLDVDGWEKSKARKKRSGIKSDALTSTVMTRPLDVDREPKQGMLHRLVPDSRPRLSNTHGFRSGPANGAAGVGKVDVSSQQNGLGIRSSTSGTDRDNGSLSNDRRDRPLSSDKERVIVKAVNRPNIRDDIVSLASPTSTTKMIAAARAPRSGSCTIPKSSPNAHRAIGVPDDWELSQCMNKVHAVAGTNNRKRTPSPVAQWAGQRPQKKSRVARRTNFVPLVSGQDEALTSNTVTQVAGNENGLGLRRLSGSQQVKLKGDNLSSAALSESEESGAAETKSKDKGKKFGEIDEKAGQNVQRVATLVLSSRKNKVSTDEDLGDGVRRQGRTGRGFSSTRSGMSMTIEKIGNGATAKQLRSARIGFDKIDSKAGRPPAKKLSDRKAYTRPRLAVDNGALDFQKEPENIHEELSAAAKAAINPTHACSGPFWRQMEPLFGFVSAEEIAYLKQQICLTDEYAADMHVTCGTNSNLKGNLGPSLHESERDIEFTNETEPVEFHSEQWLPGIRVHNVIPLCQRLIAALISEEENEGFCSIGDEDLKFDIYGASFDLDEELKSNNLSQLVPGISQTIGRAASNGYKITATRGHLDQMEHDELGYTDAVSVPNISLVSDLRHSLNSFQPDQAVIPAMACTEFQYDQMSMNERLLLEVQSIGIFPEPVPDLAQGEDEEISEDISRCHGKLHILALKKKKMLCKLEISATQAREFQEREIERNALDKLVGMAYDKYMRCWGPHAPGGKSVSSKMAKHGALAFVERTLERCEKFEDTGRSCFNEPIFKDLFLSVSSQLNDGECTDIITEGESADPCADTPTRSSELRVPASMGSQQTPVTSGSGQNMDTHDKFPSDAFQSGSHLSEPITVKEDTWSCRVKKRELLLDDVVGGTVGTSLRTPSGIGSSLLSGTKGKRSERDREGKGHNRELLSRNGTAKIGRPALSNAKGERKSKMKPKQKTTQLSASVNGRFGKVSEIPKVELPPVPKSCEMVTNCNTKEKDELGLDTLHDPEAIDLLPGMDVGSWLNIDDEGLQDHDFMGLEIPMDDLSDLNMMV